MSEVTEAKGTILQEFQAITKQKDSGFGGLERVHNKQDNFVRYIVNLSANIKIKRSLVYLR